MDDLQILHDDHALLSAEVVHVVALIKSLELNSDHSAPLFVELSRQVELLRHQLVEHFAFEEHDAFPRVSEAYTGAGPQLDYLCQQHEKVLNAFDELLASLQATIEPDWSTAVARSDHFESVFIAHATAEAELLRELSIPPE